MCFSFSSLNYRWCSLSKEKLLQRAIQGVFTQASSILQNCLGFCETLPVHLTVEILKLRKFLSYIFLAPHCPVHQSGHHGCNLQSDVKSFTKYWASFSNLTQSLCFLQLLISWPLPEVGLHIPLLGSLCCNVNPLHMQATVLHNNFGSGDGNSCQMHLMQDFYSPRWSRLKMFTEEGHYKYCSCKKTLHTSIAPIPHP